MMGHRLLRSSTRSRFLRARGRKYARAERPSLAVSDPENSGWSVSSSPSATIWYRPLGSLVPRRASERLAAGER